MGWFCTTSFGGDAFQMGSVESFFTLLLLFFSASGSFINAMMVSLSSSLSSTAHTLTHPTFVIRPTQTKNARSFADWMQMCTQTARCQLLLHVFVYKNGAQICVCMFSACRFVAVKARLKTLNFGSFCATH